MTFLALRVINKSVSRDLNSDVGDRLLDRLWDAFPGAVILPTTLTDVMPIVNRFIDENNSFMWVDCGYSSSDEGTFLTAPVHRCTLGYGGGSGDALDWYCVRFIPALLKLLLIQEEKSTAMSNDFLTEKSSDAVQFCWFAFRSTNEVVVDLVAPFVSSHTIQDILPEVGSDENALLASFNHLVIRDVSEFVEHVKRVVTTPSFIRAREYLSHIFCLTCRGISYTVCVIHEAHTEMFVKVLTCSIDVSHQSVDHPMSFPCFMQSVKSGLFLNIANIQAPHISTNFVPVKQCWCIRVGSNQWEDPLDVMSIVQQLKDGEFCKSSPVTSLSNSSFLRYETVYNIEKPVKRRCSTVRQILLTETPSSLLSSLVELNAVRRNKMERRIHEALLSESQYTSSYSFILFPLLEQLLLGDERLRREKIKTQEGKEYYILLECEVGTLQEEIALTQRTLDLFHGTTDYDDDGMDEFPVGILWKELQQQEEEKEKEGGDNSLKDIRAYFEDVKENLQHSYRLQMDQLAYEEVEGRLDYERFCEEQSTKRHNETVKVERELLRIKNDIDITIKKGQYKSAELLVSQQHSLTSSDISICTSYSQQPNVRNLTKSLRQRKRDFWPLEVGVQRLQKEIDTVRQLTRTVKLDDLQLLGTVHLCERRCLEWAETSNRMHIECEHSVFLSSCLKRWDDEGNSEMLKSPLITALSAAKKKYTRLKEEWETAQREQTCRQENVENEIWSLKEYNLNLRRELMSLQSIRTAHMDKQSYIIKDLRNTVQCEFKHLFNRMTKVMNYLSQEENENIPNTHEWINKGIQNDRRCALQEANIRDSHLTLHHDRQVLQSRMHNVIQIQNKAHDFSCDGTLLFIQQICGDYFNLCQNLEERKRLQAEITHLSKFNNVNNTTEVSNVRECTKRR